MRAGVLLALVLIPIIPCAEATPLLVAVVPDLPGSASFDEGFAVGSRIQADLAGWSVRDAQGTYTFPAGTALQPGGLIWVTGNQQAWALHDGPPALDGSASGIRLANDGDLLQLRDPAGTVVDEVEWGKDTGLGLVSAGIVYRRDVREGSWLDTDASADWITPRDHRIGESNLDQPSFAVNHVTVYSSPDSSHAVLLGLLAAAQSRIHVHVYELRSASLTDALVAAKQRHPALTIDVLVDEAPVGMTASERHATAAALQRIQAAGGRVHLAGSGRYDDHHLKVLVADDAVAVQSENWVDSGVPQDPTTGNRGWGVVIHDRAAADWFDAWLTADHEAWDVKAFDLQEFDPLFDPPARSPPRTGTYGPIVPARELHGALRVTPLVSPDHTADPRTTTLAALLGGATQRIHTQQLDLALRARNDIGWRSDDLLTAQLEAAALRGVDVRVLAARPFGSDAGNQPVLDRLLAAGAEAGVVRREGITTLHNKGFVIDDLAIVGSMNGNHHSRSANREVDVILEGPGVADAYEALFAADWELQTAGGDASVIGKDVRGIPAGWPMLLAGLAIAFLIRGRR